MYSCFKFFSNCFRTNFVIRLFMIWLKSFSTNLPSESTCYANWTIFSYLNTTCPFTPSCLFTRYLIPLSGLLSVCLWCISFSSIKFQVKFIICRKCSLMSGILHSKYLLTYSNMHSIALSTMGVRFRYCSLKYYNLVGET